MPARPSPHAILAVFFLQAFAGGGIFPRIPDLQAALGLNEAELGLVLMGMPLGGLSSLLFANRITERFGTRAVCLMAILGLAITTLCAGLAPAPLLLFIALAANGAAFSLSNVAMNVEADRVEFTTGRPVMNRCHGLWSIGMTLATLLGAAARGASLTPALHFALSAMIVLLGLVFLAPRLAPARARPIVSRKPGFVVLPNRLTACLVGFGLVGGVVQGSVHNWGAIFMRDSFAVADWIDALPLPVFLVFLTAGRLMGDRMTARYRAAAVARALALVTFVGVMMTVAAPHPAVALAGFGLLGLGIAVVFPMMVSAAAQAPDRPAAESVAAITLLSGLVMLAVPPAIGMLAELHGIRTAFLLMVPAILISAAMIRHIDRPGPGTPPAASGDEISR